MAKKSKKKLKIFLILGGILVVLILFVAALVSNTSSGVPVTAEKPERGTIVSLVTATGKVEPRTTVQISANVSAKIIRIAVEEGDTVSEGQLLVELEPDQYQAMVDQYRAGLKSARAQLRLAGANLERAELDLQRQKKLFDKGLTSRETYDIARINYNVQKAQYESVENNVEQSRASLDRALSDLEKCTITSPIAGVVTALDAEVGEIAMPVTVYSTGRPMMTISDLSVIEVKAEVDETDIAFVKLGQPAQVELDAFPDTSFAGEVVAIGNSARSSVSGIAEQVVNFEVTVLLKEDLPAVKPGMSASVDITTDIRENALHVPIQAIVMRELPDEEASLATEAPAPEAETGPGDTASAAGEAQETAKTSGSKKKKKEVEGVFVVEDGKARFVPVKTGIADQQNIEIVEGISEDQLLVIGSYRTLRELHTGDKVTVKEKKES